MFRKLLIISILFISTSCSIYKQDFQCPFDENAGKCASTSSIIEDIRQERNIK